MWSERVNAFWNASPMEFYGSIIALSVLGLFLIASVLIKGGAAGGNATQELEVPPSNVISLPVAEEHDNTLRQAA